MGFQRFVLAMILNEIPMPPQHLHNIIFGKMPHGVAPTDVVWSYGCTLMGAPSRIFVLVRDELQFSVLHGQQLEQ